MQVAQQPGSAAASAVVQQSPLKEGPSVRVPKEPSPPSPKAPPAVDQSYRVDPLRYCKTGKDVTVTLRPAVKTDIRSLKIHVRDDSSVHVFKFRMADILGCSPDRLMVCLPGEHDPLPEWAPVPSEAHIEDSWLQGSILYDMLEVVVNASDTFLLRFQPAIGHDGVVAMLMNILAADSMDLRTRDGQPWTYPQSRGASAELHVRVNRGGMRNQSPQREEEVQEIDASPDSQPRSVLSTLPFVPAEAVPGDLPTQETQEPEAEPGEPSAQEPQEQAELDADPDSAVRAQPEPLQQEDMHLQHAEPMQIPVMEARSRSRSPEREPDSPASGSSINSARYRSDVLPPTPPAAQRDRISRDGHDHMGIVGQFRAVPDALVDDVIADMEQSLHTSAPIRYYPGHAQLWHEVTSVVLPTPYVIEGELAIDLRNGRWENYCPIRRVPLLFSGSLYRVLCLPRHLTVQEAQSRIQNRAPPDHLWQLITVGLENWMAQRLILPAYLQEELMAYRQLMRVARGSALPPRSLSVHLAHTPGDRFVIDVDDHVSPRQISMQLSLTTGIPAEGILVVLDEKIHAPNAMLLSKHIQYPVAFMVSFLHDDQYHWPAHKLDIWHAWLFQCGAYKGYTEAMNTHHLVFGLKAPPLAFVDAPPLPRGGARKQKAQQDPKAAMFTASIKTVTMIFKAEYRTVTAVLNARSKFQTYQVIEAAYKRANLAPPSRPEKSSSDDKAVSQVPVGDDPQMHSIFAELTRMRQAMLNQTMLMDQLLKILVNLPTNNEFVQLLESVKGQSAAHSSGLDALFQVMTAIQQLLDPEYRQTDPSAPTPMYSSIARRLLERGPEHQEE